MAAADALPPLLRHSLRLCVVLWWWLSFAAVPLHGSTPTPSPSPTPEAHPYSATEAGDQLENTRLLREEVESDLAADRILTQLSPELEQTRREIRQRLRETETLLAATPTLERLRTSEEVWRKFGDQLTGWSRDLTTRAQRIDQLLGPIRFQELRWQETLRTSRQSEPLPKEIESRIEEAISSLAATRKRAQQQRGDLLKIQNRVLDQNQRVTSTISRIKGARTAALERLFTREAPPIWRLPVGPGESSDSEIAFLSFQMTEVRDYLRAHPEAFLFHGVVFVLVALAVFAIRRRVRELEPAGGEGTLEYAWLIFRLPLSTAFLLTLLTCGWIYPEAPHLFRVIWGAAALIPSTIILRKLLEPAFYPLLNTLVAFYLFDQMREVATPFPVLSRYLFTGEMAAAAVIAWWVLRRMSEGHSRAIAAAARFAVIAFTVALAANLVGYERLSLLLGEGLLWSLYLAVILAGALRVVDGIALGVLTFGPVSRLRVVQRHRDLLWRRLQWLLHFGALLFWIGASLHRFALRDPFLEKNRQILTAKLEIGGVGLSLSNVLLFIVTVWAAFLLSRVIRFVLDEEVYPRLPLARGLPYAISTMLHYAILLFGFFMAVIFLGFNLTQFTILAGAFGVGLGFGLQNVINNFVSGLIILFERPVKVGDTIVLNGNDAVVRQIGIRASVVETPVGSEIIVPNGQLIAERLTNWTYSNRLRGFDIELSLPPGVDANAVLALLKTVAGENAGIAATPAPEALCVKIAATADFTLRVWTHHSEQWQKIRSDLTIALHAALEATQLK